MAEIATQQVVNFANEQVRPFCNKLFDLYWQAKQIDANYNAGNIGSLINDAGAGELIADGSARDGRTRITGGDVYNVMTAIGQLVAYVEGGAVTTANRLAVITKPHVG